MSRGKSTNKGSKVFARPRTAQSGISGDLSFFKHKFHQLEWHEKVAMADQAKLDLDYDTLHELAHDESEDVLSSVGYKIQLPYKTIQVLLRQGDLNKKHRFVAAYIVEQDEIKDEDLAHIMQWCIDSAVNKPDLEALDRAMIRMVYHRSEPFEAKITIHPNASQATHQALFNLPDAAWANYVTQEYWIEIYKKTLDINQNIPTEILNGISTLEFFHKINPQDELQQKAFELLIQLIHYPHSDKELLKEVAHSPLVQHKHDVHRLEEAFNRANTTS
jgi:imidazoleglycerol phosphate dehydratase HisB